MRILVIDNVNYEDYPTGGILNFYRNMLPAFGNDLLLAGITTDCNTKIGVWTKKNIGGVDFDYFSMAKVTPSSKRPLIPERITNCFYIRKYIGKILRRNDFDWIVTHKPEVMYFVPNAYMSRTCYIMPGVENPLSISRYPWAHCLAGLYDRFFLMPKASKAQKLLAAADYNDRRAFADRSNGRINVDDVIEFPTRYDDGIYGVCNKERDSEKTVFLTVGRLGWFKGWKLMIDAFRLVCKSLDNARLYFIGDGEDHDKIRDYVKKLGMDNTVILLGKKSPEDIAKWLNKADVFVMGSMAEGWSTTLVEACACGVPCVVTDFSSAREMIKDNHNGYVVEGRDEIVFSKRMIDALSLDRAKVAEYDKRFEKLAVSHLREDMEKLLSLT